MSSSYHFNAKDTHHLVPERFADGSDPLEGLGLSIRDAEEFGRIIHAKSERVVVLDGCSLNLKMGELAVGYVLHWIVNNAFFYPGSGARFNDSTRGAWYAGLDIDTSIAEVAYHKHIALKDTNYLGEEPCRYRDFMANFDTNFYWLDGYEIAECLKPEPVPHCYRPGQTMARYLLNEGENGIVYDSVRRKEGRCLVCFRPKLILDPRRGAMVEFTVSGASPLPIAQRLS